MYLFEKYVFKVQCFIYLINFWVEFSCTVMTKQDPVQIVQRLIFCEKREEKSPYFEEK